MDADRIVASIQGNSAWLTADILTEIGVSPSWLRPLSSAMGLYAIDTADRMAMFLAQAAHESSGLTVLSENLNYSPAGLLGIFPKYFTSSEVADYARAPERIANRVYANRMGNGGEASGDGWRYRGRGPIQITGNANYARCGKGIGVDLVAKPELLSDDQTNGALSAAWFWATNGCNELADFGNYLGITRKINGGLNGQTDRDAWLCRVRKAMQ